MMTDTGPFHEITSLPLKPSGNKSPGPVVRRKPYRLHQILSAPNSYSRHLPLETMDLAWGE